MTPVVDPTRVVVDTNILFAALLHKEARLREVILTDPIHRFFSPRFVMVKLFKHKERMPRDPNGGKSSGFINVRRKTGSICRICSGTSS